MTQIVMRVQMRNSPLGLLILHPLTSGTRLVLVGVLALIFPGMGTRFSAMGQFSALRQLFDVTYFEPRLMGSYIGWH